MTKLQEAITQAAAGEPIDPAYLQDEPADMASRYAEVFHYFGSQKNPYVRLTNWPGEPHNDGGMIRKLVAKVPGAIRFDGCCDKCGEGEFHTAGWTNDEAGNKARASVRKVKA